MNKLSIVTILVWIACVQSSSDDTLVVNALGRQFFLGSLYNANKDMIIPTSLWKKNKLEQFITERPTPRTKYEIKAGSSLKHKMSLLDVSVGLKLSFLSGLIKVSGSAKYLDDRASSQYAAHVDLAYYAQTHVKKLNMDHLTNLDYPNELEKTEATHVVAQIQYGANSVFTFIRQESSGHEKKKVEGQVSLVINALPGVEIDGSGSIKLTEEQKKAVKNLKCRYNGDIRPDTNPTTYAQAVKLYSELPKKIKKETAVPVKVWLYPLSKLDSKAKRLVRQISAQLVNRVEETFNHLQTMQQKAKDLIRFHKAAAKMEILQAHVVQFNSQVKLYETQLQKKLLPILPKIRGGGTEEQILADLFIQKETSIFSKRSLRAWIRAKQYELNAMDALFRTSTMIPFGNSALTKFQFDPDIDWVVALTLQLHKENNDFVEVMKKYTSSGWKSKDVMPDPKSDWDVGAIRRSFKSFRHMFDANKGQKGFKTKYVIVQEKATGKKAIFTKVYKQGSLKISNFHYPDILKKAAFLTIKLGTFKVAVTGDNGKYIKKFTLRSQVIHGTNRTSKIHRQHDAKEQYLVFAHGGRAGTLATISTHPVFDFGFGRLLTFTDTVPQVSHIPKFEDFPRLGPNEVVDKTPFEKVSSQDVGREIDFHWCNSLCYAYTGNEGNKCMGWTFKESTCSLRGASPKSNAPERTTRKPS